MEPNSVPPAQPNAQPGGMGEAGATPPPPPPYSAPIEPPPSPPYGAALEKPPYPLFCKIVFIVDACMSGLRLLAIPLAIIGLAAMRKQANPLAPTALPELATHVGLLLFGVSAPIAMLLRRRWGLGLAGFAVLFSLASMGIACWQLSIQSGTNAFPKGSPEQMGFYVGAGCVIVFRVALLLLYGVALFKFEKWSRYLTEPQELGYRQ